MNALDEAIGRRGGAGAVAHRSRERALEDFDAPTVRKLDYVAAEELDTADSVFDDELVEGVLGRGTMAVLFGESNSGKTFAAIDLGAAVCRGEPWLGRNAMQGLVLYLATEAAGSVCTRLKAYQRHHGVPARGFIIVQSPINLFDGEADVTAVLAAVDEIQSLYGDKVALIIGDTMARIAAGANENSGEDMGVVIQHADAIRQATGATFLWIHHSGKDSAKGARGWSGIRGAIDTEIEITVDEALGTHAAEITKQRDLEGKGTRLGFTLRRVPLGVNAWGTERGSCVVESTEPPPRKAKAAGRKPALSTCARAILSFLAQRGSGCKVKELVDYFGNLPPQPDASVEMRYHARATVYRAIDQLREAARISESVGVVSLLGPAVSAA